ADGLYVAEDEDHPLDFYLPSGGDPSLVCLVHRSLGPLKTNLRMSSVAKGFVHGAAATAQRECGLAAKIVCVAIRVHQFDRSLRGFYAIRTISSNRNLHLRHAFPPGLELIVSCFKFRVSSQAFLKLET